MLYRYKKAHGHGDDKIDHEDEEEGGYPFVHNFFFLIRPKYRKKKSKSKSKNFHDVETGFPGIPSLLFTTLF
jgi:hypothetical protein